jgi:hypothetical protein
MKRAATTLSAARALRLRLRARLRPGMGKALAVLFAGALFAISALPGVLALLPPSTDPLAALEKRGPELAELAAEYRAMAQPVQELRPMLSFPAQWEGHWYDTDKNYQRFEKWFADNLGMRSLMIRAKNEVDFQLFGSSSRVYYGSHGELFGRNMADNELPATEALLATPQQADARIDRVLRFAAKLQAQGTTLVLVAPFQKQYLVGDRLPFFAPRLPANSHFMALTERLARAPSLHFVDLRPVLRENQGKFPLYYRQDFHWTDLTALAMARATTDMIAGLEGVGPRWQHAPAYANRPFTGSESRFAARLNASDTIDEPTLTPTWKEVHVRTPREPASGVEFETDTLADAALLPSTCMYGNSFGDGMLRAGLPEYFSKFTKLSRDRPVTEAPKLIEGRCKYLIVQLLDSQTGQWNLLSAR